jgi:poly-D-alanine transfer protein DltD
MKVIFDLIKKYFMNDIINFCTSNWLKLNRVVLDALNLPKKVVIKKIE